MLSSLICMLGTGIIWNRLIYLPSICRKEDTRCSIHFINLLAKHPFLHSYQAYGNNSGVALAHGKSSKSEDVRTCQKPSQSMGNNPARAVGWELCSVPAAGWEWAARGMRGHKQRRTRPQQPAASEPPVLFSFLSSLSSTWDSAGLQPPIIPALSINQMDAKAAW